MMAHMERLLRNCLKLEFISKNLGPTKINRQIIYIRGKIISAFIGISILLKNRRTINS